jgi:hypothetical protein
VRHSSSFSIPMPIPIPIPTRAEMAPARTPRPSSPCRVGLLPLESYSGSGSIPVKPLRPIPPIPEGFQQIARGREAHPGFTWETKTTPEGLKHPRVPHQGRGQRLRFTTKGTNDTKPIHQPGTQSVAPGPEGRQTIAQRVSAGFHPPMKTSPGGATDSPLLHTPDSNSPLERIPHARFASSRLRVSPFGPIP